MKIKTALLAAALAVPAFATTAPAVNNYKAELPAATKRVSGALQVGYATNYTGRGYVVSHSVAEGDSVLSSALKLNYDFGKEGLWSASLTLSYTVPTSGHTLYGNPGWGANAMVPVNPGVSYPAGDINMAGKTIKQANIENEFAVVSAVNYKAASGLWNVSFGHDYIHGGLLGVMSKHYAKNGASGVNEFFVLPEWTPYKWLTLGMKTSYSFQGIEGWWFEPTVTVKAPIVGTPEDIKVAGVLTLGMTASYGYFADWNEACDNGAQAFYIKFQTPWFVKKNLIITPGVSFNWLGNGGISANKVSKFREYTCNDTNVPFRNFGVVGSISVTYTF